MSNESAGSLNEQLTQSASTVNVTQQQTQGEETAASVQDPRREASKSPQGGNQPRTGDKLSVDGSSQQREKFASRSTEEFTLSALESGASPGSIDGKRPLEAPFPIGDARHSGDSGILTAPFSHTTPADKVDDLADIPKGASSPYREKYAAVMREFRDGKLQIVVKDRSVAVALAAERATKADAGQQQKEASGTQQKQASSADEKQASSPQQKQVSSNDQKQGR
jgi:hypothetical protein